MSPDGSSWENKRRHDCRLCGSNDLTVVISLTPTPPANGLLSATGCASDTRCFPLDVVRCAACHHLQLHDVVHPERLFRNYLYVSGTSQVMVRHLERQAREIIARLALSEGDLVVEIGSNDGTMLSFFQDQGLRVVGVDPARNLADRATARGIPTIPEFFTPEVAARIIDDHGQAAAVCANHCLAHIDDLSTVVGAVGSLLAPEGELIFEVGYLLDVYRKTLFDTIYHEHLDYHHVEPLVGFFQRHDMTLVHVQRAEIQGGALRGFVKQGDAREEPSIEALLALERAAGLDRAETFLAFNREIDGKADELKSLLHGLKAEGRRIAGYGVPAKATTLMHHFGLDRSVIDFIVDDNPLKQGMFTPGLHVPIEPVSALYERRPDDVLILAWNFADSIMAAHDRYHREGGRFIVPLPSLSIQ